MNIVVFLCLLLVSICASVPFDTCDISDNQRFDCFPDNGASEETCKQRGCCWRPASTSEPLKDKFGVPLNVPYCFYGTGRLAMTNVAAEIPILDSMLIYAGEVGVAHMEMGLRS